MKEIVIGGNYTIYDRPMISGIGEAESKKFKVIVGKSGKRWLYNDDVRGCGANVYVEGVKGSPGFGGSTITFQLVEGGELQLKGPWHSNCDSLYRDTGIDLRMRHITYGVIGLDRTYNRNSQLWVIENVIYFDSAPVEGDFNRIEQLANEKAIELGREVAYYSQSHGGSTCGFTQALKNKKG